MSKYYEYWVANGQPSYNSIAKAFGVNESTVRRSIKRRRKQEDSRSGAEKAVLQGMDQLGFRGQPSGGWVKTQNPDPNDPLGTTYSFYFNNSREEEDLEDRLDQIEERFKNTPPVQFKLPALRLSNRKRKAFISINDLHSGALAWGQETGFGDWDTKIALERLTDWLTRLYAKIDAYGGVDEIILYYNGDTLHANGQIPMTATHGTNHILDVDSRHFKVVDLTGETIIHTTDLAAQVSNVRLVIKRGNHDADSYLALLQGAKWRYINQSNVVVEMSPGPYWAHIFGKVALFGHHGDKIKPDVLAMKFLQKYRKEIADCEHISMWTGDKHHKMLQQFPGVMWEQASNWSEPDEYGSKWGSNAMAQCIIYDELEGEVDRFTVKPYNRKV